MNEFNTETIVSLVAIIVAVISLIVSWRTFSRTSVWQREDLKIRRESEERKKLEPYIELTHNTYCEFKDMFSEYSSSANLFFSNVVSMADKYYNGKGTNKHALRHHMSYACYNVIDKLNEDILFQHPLCLFSLLGEYRQIDYKLDLKGKNNLNNIEVNLKALYENIDIQDQALYFDEMKSQIVNVNEIYIKNKEKIDKSIEVLEKALIKYEHYDFDRTITNLYSDFTGLLNLLRYIKDVSNFHPHDFVKEYKILIVSEIFYAIASIMIVNKGILKLSKY